MSATDADEIADLRARLMRLEDERAIITRLHRYGQSIDAGDEAAWVDCFTEDGSFRSGGRVDRPTREVNGRDALRAFIARHSRRPERYHQHVLVEPIVVLDGDTASCSSAFMVLMEHKDQPLLRVFGRYDDELVRDTDGAWRFRLRISSIDSMREGLPPLAGGRPDA
jgi:hypothetical protein